MNPDRTVSTTSITYDEGIVQLTENGQTPIRIGAHTLDLRFNSVPGGITITAKVGLVARENTIVTKTFTERVTFRNP